MELKSNIKTLTLFLFIILVVLGSVTWITRDVEGPEEDYKEIVEDLNHIFESYREGGDPSDTLDRVKQNYEELFEGYDLDDDLINEIENDFGELEESFSEDGIISLRSNIAEAADQLDVGLPLAYGNSSLLIALISLLIGLVSTLVCKLSIDWDDLKETKEMIKEKEKRIKELRNKSGKKGQKFDMDDKKIIEGRKKIWGVSITQASVYLGLFLLFIPLFRFIYNEWMVAWLPFDWFTTGAFESIGVSLEYFGWYIFTFFGFSYLWRNLLLNKEEKLVQ